MENIFSLKRFWLLVRKHANDNWKILLISLIVMAIPSVITQLIWYIHDMETLFQYYIFCLVLIGGVYTGMFFKKWTRTASTISFLMLPATALEKIALVLFYTVVLFVPIVTGIVYSSHFVIFKIANPEMTFSISELYDDKSFILAFVFNVLLPYAFFQSIFLLFYVWFKKWQFVIALAVLVILEFIIIIWGRQYIPWLTGDHQNHISTESMLFPTNITFNTAGEYVGIANQLSTDISRFIYVVIILLLYIASYFKLKEKEI